MAVRWLSAFVVALVVCCCLQGFSNAAVISIDFGSEWIKVALVKPGVPMEIVLNKESKRKTAAVVSLRNNDRQFGDPALSTAVKYPKSAYRYLQLLIGQKFDSPIVQKYREWFPFYDIRKDEERGTVLFQHDEDTVYSVEELVGMIFNNSRHIGEAYAGVPIRDVVITVPPFFNQAQRRTVVEAANLVGLTVLQLMSENSAAALNYGLFRQASFNTTPHYIMFYDQGAASTTATIVEYRKAQVKEGSIVNVHPQLTVKGTGFNRLLGGLQMELRLQQYLAKTFQEQGKTKGSVYDSPRAMAKLLKEAKRLKQVLSANTDHYAQIEGLLEDVDFRTKVTRAEFESMCSDLLEQVGDPVRQALEAADMTMEEIDSVILVGGGTRVPKVQENLLKVVNKPELGKSLNTDEAIALGAVYQGAGHTKLFRVKKFIVKDGTSYPIQVSFSRVTSSQGEDGEEEETVKTVKRTLFQRSNPYPAKKVLTFNRHSADFAFQVFYGDLAFLSPEEKSYLGRLNLSEVYLAGVVDALSQHPQGEAKGIKAHFYMDESGLLNLTGVQSVFEYPEDVPEPSTLSKIGSTISNFFGMGGDDSAKKEPSESEGEEIPADANETESQSESVPTPEPPQPDSESVDSGTEPSQDHAGETETAEPESDKSETDSDETPKSEQEEGTPEEEVGQEAVEEEVSQEEVVQESTETAGEEEEEEVGPEEGEEPTSQPPPTGEADDDGTTSQSEEKLESESAVNETTSPLNGSNGTESASTNTTASKKTKAAPKGSVVKVNLTAEVTILDLQSPSSAKTALSIEKLTLLQQVDEDKVANERAKNALESHIFETRDSMYSEPVQAVSTEDQREVITTALTEAADWLDDEGYIADTSTYKGKLRELKKISRALFKRVKEAEQRPKLLGKLASSLNISQDFLGRMKNLTGEVQIFTEVEITTLENLIAETGEWATKKLAEQDALPPHEEPVLLSYEIEEQTKKLDREIMYLINKLRSHTPKVKVPSNRTNDTAGNTTTAGNDTKTENTAKEGSNEEASTEEAPPTDDAPPIEEPTSSVPTEGTLPDDVKLEIDPDSILPEPPQESSKISDDGDTREEL